MSNYTWLIKRVVKDGYTSYECLTCGIDLEQEEDRLVHPTHTEEGFFTEKLVSVTCQHAGRQTNNPDVFKAD